MIRRLGCALLVILGGGMIALLVIDSMRMTRVELAEGRARDDLRVSEDIARMWLNEIRADQLPNLAVGEARTRLRKVLDAEVGEQTKDQARRLLGRFDRAPHYLAFAANARRFASEGPRYLLTWWAVARGDPDLAPPADAPPRPRHILAFTVESPERADRDQPPAPVFDAELIEACGTRAARTPEEVDALVAVEWSRTQIGDYRLTGFRFGGRFVPIRPDRRHPEGPEPSFGSAYLEAARVTLIEYPSGRVVARRTFLEEDPDQFDRERGKARIRRTVLNFLATIAR